MRLAYSAGLPRSTRSRDFIDCTADLTAGSAVFFVEDGNSHYQNHTELEKPELGHQLGTTFVECNQLPMQSMAGTLKRKAIQEPAKSAPVATPKTLHFDPDSLVGTTALIIRGKYKGKLAFVERKVKKKYRVQVEGVGWGLEFYPNVFSPEVRPCADGDKLLDNAKVSHANFQPVLRPA